MPYLIARGDHRKTIKGIKVLRVKCTPVTGIAKGIVIAHNSRRLPDLETITNLVDQWIRNISNKLLLPPSYFERLHTFYKQRLFSTQP